MTTQDSYYHQMATQKTINVKKIRNITFLVIYAIFAFYFLINGPGIFQEWNSGYTVTTIIYMLGVSIFLGVQEHIPRNLERPVEKSMLGFAGAFLISTALFILLRDAGLYFQNINPMPLDQIPFTLVYQLVIVVASEEIIFRGILLELFNQIHWLVAVIGTSVLFALFHFAVYGANLGSMMLAFFLAIVFDLIGYITS